MTTYKEIKGQLIRQVSSDPSDPQIGQIWYNNTTGFLKGFLTINAAWSAGGNLNTARRDLAGCGTKSLALGFGGLETGTTSTGKTEEYNGSSWSEQSDMSAGERNFAGFGTQTAALAAGGIQAPGTRFSSNSEEYNGSSWTSGGSLNSGRDIMTGAGTQTSGVVFGGFGSPPASGENKGLTENGTN